MISSSGDHLIAKLSCNNLVAKLSPIQETKIKAEISCKLELLWVVSQFLNNGWQINKGNTNRDQSASTYAPQGTARYPTKARGPTQKPPHPQKRLDSCAVLPKIPPGIPGLQIFGSHRQDSAICVKDSHRQNLRPVPGPRPALREHEHQHPSHHQRQLVIMAMFWSL